MGKIFLVPTGPDDFLPKSYRSHILDPQILDPQILDLQVALADLGGDIRRIPPPPNLTRENPVEYEHNPCGIRLKSLLMPP